MVQIAHFATAHHQERSEQVFAIDSFTTEFCKSMDSIQLPSRQSTVVLREVTANNWKAITELVVNREQLGLVPPNLESLCEHQFYTPKSIVRAIEADNVPVGYIRLHQEQEEQDQGHDNGTGDGGASSSIFLLRSFMIDQACQGLGFGTKAMLLLQEEIRGISRGKAIVKVPTKPFAIVHPDDSPEHFLAGTGFRKDKGGQGQAEEMIWES
ncbi:MAG: hypothetical protein J3Q66DRAFT_350291 [Benniella sp.]|nr:MAG: hypothetical protein J3Q66DRAFT_350291 [Benniella sp.]